MTECTHEASSREASALSSYLKMTESICLDNIRKYTHTLSCSFGTFRLQRLSQPVPEIAGIFSSLQRLPTSGVSSTVQKVME